MISSDDFHDADVLALGRKVLDMAARVEVSESIVPGARACSGFDVGDTTFDLMVKVRAL